jgi:thiol:disulfide interchange protein
MFGLFEIILPARLSNVNIAGKGYLSAMGMGMLATVLATPCGAPLLGGVLTWSLGKPLGVTMMVFMVIALGMALPYVLLTAWPGLLSRVPSAGSWMLRLKQAIGFAMLGFTVYLILLFPSPWIGPLLYYCVIMGICVWLALSLVNRNTPLVKRLVTRFVAVMLLAGASVLLMQTFDSAPPQDTTQSDLYWKDQLDGYQAQGKTVIVKFTANWCKNCATLDQLIYKTPTFKAALAAAAAELVVADFSYGDPQIKTMLTDLAGTSATLPFAAVFPGDGDRPILLRDFYSLDNAISALQQAGNE